MTLKSKRGQKARNSAKARSSRCWHWVDKV